MAQTTLMESAGIELETPADTTETTRNDAPTQARTEKPEQAKLDATSGIRLGRSKCPLCSEHAVKETTLRNAAEHKRKTCTNCHWGYIKGIA